MKKLLAALLFTVFLTPDAAWATYSCYGTRSPCDLTGGIKVNKLDVQKTSKHHKKSKKKSKKKAHHVVKQAKKHVSKNYCYPEPRLKPDTVMQDNVKQTPVPPAEMAPVKVPDAMPQ